MDRSGVGGDERFAEARRRMVSEQLERRGIRDTRVLDAMAQVPRHAFVDAALADEAYEDHPLPIGFGQTISQPYMVARATELAAPTVGDRVLEIGAGCGYQAAVLATLSRQVFAVEIVPGLAAFASERLEARGISNVVVGAFDGGAGWADNAPYDVIIVSAGAPRIPPLLIDQLADGGRLVIPLGPHEEQTLAVVRRLGERYEITDDTRCRYVDLQGRYGAGGEPPIA
jgi:protein-L-isoaspartate(D-aspartate) O-methyltransferase